MPKHSIILAGGSGSRMRSSDRHKTCFPVDGKPAISRAIETYTACGIAHHVVVVGSRAEQVMQVLSRDYSGIMFAFQPQQLGTANAAKMGADVLAGIDGEEGVLVVAGDKVIEPIALERLIHEYTRHKCDLAFLIGKKEPDSSLGTNQG